MIAAVVALILVSPLGVAGALCIGVALWLAGSFPWEDRRGFIRFNRDRYLYHRGKLATGAGFQAIGNPGSPTGTTALRFTTDSQPVRLVTTSADRGAPVGVRFTQPMDKYVSSNDVPTQVRYAGRRIFAVKQFDQTGIVIERQLPGVDIAADVSYGGGVQGPSWPMDPFTLCALMEPRDVRSVNPALGDQ